MDFDIGSWFSDFSMPDATTVSEIGKTAQLAGLGASVVGSYFSSDAQRTALTNQAGMDEINARANYQASSAQNGLDWINAQMSFANTKFQADMAVSAAEGQAAKMRTEGQIGMVKAQAAAAGDMASAAIDENQAHFAELQAQSALLHGQWDEQSTMRKAAQETSRARTRLAHGGIDLGEGTAAVVIASVDAEKEWSLSKVKETALMQALGHRVAAENASISAGAKRSAAGATLTIAGMNQALTNQQATSLTSLTIADADYKRAMADAGLANTRAAIDLRDVMAKGNLANADAAAQMRRTTADSISPWLSATSSLISGAGRVGDSWYRYRKTTEGAG
jgi:hypothetical protein